MRRISSICRESGCSRCSARPSCAIAELSSSSISWYAPAVASIISRA
jgi:hypothetical protein